MKAFGMCPSVGVGSGTFFLKVGSWARQHGYFTRFLSRCNMQFTFAVSISPYVAINILEDLMTSILSSKKYKGNAFEL